MGLRRAITAARVALLLLATGCHLPGEPAPEAPPAPASA
jgi:hypothetical protein